MVYPVKGLIKRREKSLPLLNIKMSDWSPRGGESYERV